MDNDIVVLKFADSKIPEFKERKNRDFIYYGDNNLYHETLLKLYDKSAKHGAIVGGKANYIFGKGLKRKSNSSEPSPVVNRTGETQDEVFKKAILDREIYGGFRLMIIWDSLGASFEIYHVEFHKIRTGKEPGLFFFKDDWKDNQEQMKDYPEFNLNDKTGVQIFAYNEYRPGTRYYPLPGYIASNNYIECDIEISKYNLSCITNGMLPSKMIQFFDGDPGEEGKKEIERKWTKKFGGSENGGKFILVFGKSKEKSIQIDDLSATESDKLFIELNKTCQQEIFTGHQVVSPMLFGIKTEGQLGGNTELKTAYELFQNTYGKPKQIDIESTVNYFDRLRGGAGDYYTEQLDPISFNIEIGSVLDKLPVRFIFEKLNIPKEYWPAEETLNSEGGASGVNSTLTGLTPKQHQQIIRIARDYNKGRITRAAAVSLLKSGFGMTDEDIEAWLGVDESQEFSSVTEDDIIGMFSECGELKENFIVVKSKAVKFNSDEDAFEDELHFESQAFKGISASLALDILDLIDKDKRITPEVLADILEVTTEQITKQIAGLIEQGHLTSTEVQIGEDIQIERTLTKPLPEIRKTIDATGDRNGTEILIKYSYEGPKDNRNRPFCKRMLELDRFYSRFEIEKISQRLGYSVFDRRGGFWKRPNGTVSASCRHHFKSNVLVKKRGDK